MIVWKSKREGIYESQPVINAGTHKWSHKMLTEWLQGTAHVRLGPSPPPNSCASNHSSGFRPRSQAHRKQASRSPTAIPTANVTNNRREGGEEVDGAVAGWKVMESKRAVNLKEKNQ